MITWLRHEPRARFGGGGDGSPSGGSPGNPTGGPATSANPADTGTNATNDPGQVDAGVGVAGTSPNGSLGIASGIANALGVTSNTVNGMDIDGNATGVTSFSFDPAAAAINGAISVLSAPALGLSPAIQGLSSLATGNSIGVNVSNAFGNPAGLSDVTGVSPGGTAAAGMGAAGNGNGAAGGGYDPYGSGYGGLLSQAQEPSYASGILGRHPDPVIPKPALPSYGPPLPNWWSGNQFVIPPWNRIS